MANSTGPTIVLIGGQATLDSGATVDSRQRIVGDTWDVVLRQALGTSESWWTVAKDLVDVVLAQPDPDAWALAWVDKSLKRPRADGSFSRVRLKTFLDGAESLIEAARAPGPVTFRSDLVKSRYRLVPYMLRFEDIKGGPPPAAIVGSFHTTYDDGTDIVGDRPLDYFVSRWPDAVIVLPHTPLVAAKAQPVADRPPTSRVTISGLAEQTHKADSRRYVKNAGKVDELRRADSYVIGHNFHVTFWADEGSVRDPVDLDAALTFVRSRYDLNLGLWDLARDPVLRETLLQRSETDQPKRSRTAAPTELVTKAKEKADERQAEEEAQREGRQRHHDAIWPTLSKLGFEMPWQREGVDYRFGVGPLIQSLYFPGQEEPALSVTLAIQKRQAVVSVLETLRSERTEEFLRANSALIEGITGRPPDPEKQAVWRIQGKGWAGEVEDWPQYLAKLALLITELGPRLGPVGEAAAAAHNEHLETGVTVSPRTLKCAHGARAGASSSGQRLRFIGWPLGVGRFQPIRSQSVSSKAGPWRDTSSCATRGAMYDGPVGARSAHATSAAGRVVGRYAVDVWIGIAAVPETACARAVVVKVNDVPPRR